MTPADAPRGSLGYHLNPVSAARKLTRMRIDREWAARDDGLGFDHPAIPPTTGAPPCLDLPSWRFPSSRPSRGRCRRRRRAVEQLRPLRQKVERFDKDPGWDGFNNRVKVDKPNPVVQDFGYSKTNRAGGKAAGELGGRVQRLHHAGLLRQTARQAPYPGPDAALHRDIRGNTDDRNDEPLLRMVQHQDHGSPAAKLDGHVYQRRGKRVRNRLRLQHGDGTVRRHSCHRRRTQVGAAVRDFNQIPNDGTPYTFDFLYDPKANGGNGQISFTLGGKGPFTGGPFTFKLFEHRQAGATFNAFGIVNQQSAGNALTIYFDDLSIEGERESFGSHRVWLGQGNRARLKDYGLEGAQPPVRLQHHPFCGRQAGRSRRSGLQCGQGSRVLRRLGRPTHA